MDENEVREETKKHILKVAYRLSHMIAILSGRLLSHDKTKLEDPEFPIFVEYTPKLKDTTYGSDEYKGYLKGMKVALDHHYKAARHHPEHFTNGVNDMDLIDITEMFCDWWAATERHADGDIMTSIDKNKERFGLSNQLCKILKNTVHNLKRDLEERKK